MRLQLPIESKTTRTELGAFLSSPSHPSDLCFFFFLNFPFTVSAVTMPASVFHEPICSSDNYFSFSK